MKKGNFTAILRPMDMTGKHISSRELDLAGQSLFDLNLGYLPAGLYLVELYNDYHHFSHKIILLLLPNQHPITPDIIDL